MIRHPSVDRIESVTRCDRDVAIKVRRVIDGRDDPMIYPKTAAWAHKCYSDPRDIELQLAAIDELLDTCGTESMRSDDADWDHYWLDTVMVYCNTGDSYGGTIVYDVDCDVFYATSWADWMETAERTGRYKFQ